MWEPLYSSTMFLPGWPVSHFFPQLEIPDKNLLGKKCSWLTQLWASWMLNGLQEKHILRVFISQLCRQGLKDKDHTFWLKEIYGANKGEEGVHIPASHFDKLSFNFNYNLVESWDVYILNLPATHPPTRRSTEWPLLQLLTLTTTSTITSNLNELVTAQPQLVIYYFAFGLVLCVLVSYSVVKI